MHFRCGGAVCRISYRSLRLCAVRSRVNHWLGAVFLQLLTKLGAVVGFVGKEFWPPSFAGSGAAQEGCRGSHRRSAERKEDGL
jgi:hypothetical protein